MLRAAQTTPIQPQFNPDNELWGFFVDFVGFFVDILDLKWGFFCLWIWVAGAPRWLCLCLYEIPVDHSDFRHCHTMACPSCRTPNTCFAFYQNGFLAIFFCFFSIFFCFFSDFFGFRVKGFFRVYEFFVFFKAIFFFLLIFLVF